MWKPKTKTTAECIQISTIHCDSMQKQKNQKYSNTQYTGYNNNSRAAKFIYGF